MLSGIRGTLFNIDAKLPWPDSSGTAAAMKTMRHRVLSRAARALISVLGLCPSACVHSQPTADSSVPFTRPPGHTASPRDGTRGSHTRRSIAPCTHFVSPHGNDAEDGRSPGHAFQSPGRAVSVIRPGDVVCFDEGTYPPLHVVRARDTASEPIVFRTVPGAERKATFSIGSLEYGDGIRVDFSEYVHIYYLSVTNSQRGIELRSSSYCRIEGMLIESVGQEAIHIGGKPPKPNEKTPLGKAAHHCDVIANTVRDTGKTTARYGEGIYIGSGSGDDTHHVFIGHNRLDSIRAEAIELKPLTHDITVQGNVITNSSHQFHAAITVAVQAKPATILDGRYLIEDNRIYNYASTGSSVAGITIGHGNTIVRNNLIWAIDGGRGIRTTTTFANPSARDVLIERNTIWTTGNAPSISIDDGDEQTGITNQGGRVTVRGNLTSDGAPGSTKVPGEYFVGPISGDADAGEGLGSGFRPKRDTRAGADLRKLLSPHQDLPD